MKKTITSILIVIITLLCLEKYSYATGQLQATIEITPSTTEVVAGDTVTFTFVTKNIVNAEYGKIYAIEGIIEYDDGFFQLESGGMDVGDTGTFVSMTPVSEGGTNGTISLKVKDGATGSGKVKFTELSAGDGRIEEADSTLGIASTENREFTISIKVSSGEDEPTKDDDQGTGEKPDTGDNGDTSDGNNDDSESNKDSVTEDKNDSGTKEDVTPGTDDDMKNDKDGDVSDKSDSEIKNPNESMSEANGNNSENSENSSTVGSLGDTTTAGTQYGYAGAREWIMAIIGFVSIIVMILYVKSKKYQDIK